MFWQDRSYVSAADRRRLAQKQAERLTKMGRVLTPVRVEGRTIAATFWGKAWCDNLERYSDYASRLPRGRSYVRNGSVIDLQIGAGKIEAFVSGSDLYEVSIAVTPVSPPGWSAMCRDCAGAIDSLVELLKGRFSESVMQRLCQQRTGLFPVPAEIKLACSCPDAARMCKHVAATLYGVGARLDAKPELLFLLRAVDETELVAHAGQGLSSATTLPIAARVLADDGLADLFGLDFAEAPPVEKTDPKRATPKKRAKAKPKSPKRPRR